MLKNIIAYLASKYSASHLLKDSFCRYSFEHSALLDDDFCVIVTNDAFSDFYGSGLIGVGLFDAVVDDVFSDFDSGSFGSLVVGEFYVNDLYVRDHNGGLSKVQLKVVRLMDGYLFISQDITGFKERELQLINEAKTDKLTSLLNRKGFEERLSSVFDVTSSGGKSNFALLFLDLDGFKAINDTYGHDAGDEILIHVSSSLKSVLPSQCTIARLGGDEFVCIIPLVGDRTYLSGVCDDILKSVARNVKYLDVLISVNCSIGVAIYPNHGTTREELLSCADEAMYKSKEMGKNQFNYFS